MAKRHEEGATVGGIMLRNGHWYARIKVKGRQIWRSAPTKEGAQKLLGELREDAMRERIGVPKAQRATVKTWAEGHYLPWARTRKSSVDRDELALKHLIPVFGHLRLKDVTRSRVESYQQARLATAIPGGRTVSGPTVNREVAILRRLLSHAVDAGELEKNPLARIPMLPESPCRQPTLDTDGERRLLGECAPWLATLVRLALATGAREGELLALRWKHVEFDSGTLVVADSKSGESRRIPLHPAVLESLRDCRGLPEGWVCTKGDKQPNRWDIVPNFTRAAKRAGLAGLHFHDLRHVAATRLLSTGASLPEVATFLGHKTLAMSRRYAHVSPVRLAGLVAMMPSTAMPATSTTPKTGEVTA